MKQDFLIKTALLSLTIVMVVLIWFGFKTIDLQASKIDSLSKDVQRKDDQIQFLKVNNRLKSQEITKSENERIEESVNVFVQSLYQVQEGQLEQRREKAKTVLTQAMYDKYFPNDEKTDKLLYEHEVDESTVFTNIEGENGNAIVTFEETMTSLANNQKESSRITIEVFLQKEGEKWIVNQFKQLNAEPL
jgi:preprotein translocase subunit SecF